MEHLTRTFGFTLLAVSLLTLPIEAKPFYADFTIEITKNDKGLTIDNYQIGVGSLVHYKMGWNAYTTDTGGKYPENIMEGYGSLSFSGQDFEITHVFDDKTTKFEVENDSGKNHEDKWHTETPFSFNDPVASVDSGSSTFSDFEKIKIDIKDGGGLDFLSSNALLPASLDLIDHPPVLSSLADDKMKKFEMRWGKGGDHLEGTITDMTVVPLPGATILGCLGLATSSWFLRRKQQKQLATEA